MADKCDLYLTGKCLVSMPNMDDERFAGTLIYICSHSKEGAMGFVVNKKIKEFSFADLANQLPINTIHPIEPIDLHQGGPLEKVRGFVLHSTDYIKPDTVVIDDKIAVSSSIDIITDIAFGTGPKENLIALGYASWAPNQLEQEIGKKPSNRSALTCPGWSPKPDTLKNFFISVPLTTAGTLPASAAKRHPAAKQSAPNSCRHIFLPLPSAKNRLSSREYTANPRQCSP